MNIVAALSEQLKLDQELASGLAGGLLLLIEDVVRENVSFAAASVIRQAVPEMRDWQMSSPTLAPGMLSVDTIPPSPETIGVSGDFLAVLGRFGIDALQLKKVATLMGTFLASRLDDADFATVSQAMPLLVQRG